MTAKKKKTTPEKRPPVKITPCSYDDTWTVSLTTGNETADIIWVKPGKRLQDRLIIAGEKLKERWTAAHNAMAHLNEVKPTVGPS